MKLMLLPVITGINAKEKVKDVSTPSLKYPEPNISTGQMITHVHVA